jgi:hypothetical protein
VTSQTASYTGRKRNLPNLTSPHVDDAVLLLTRSFEAAGAVTTVVLRRPVTYLDRPPDVPAAGAYGRMIRSTECGGGVRTA